VILDSIFRAHGMDDFPAKQTDKHENRRANIKKSITSSIPK
jgi:hypothetical protein